MTNRMCTSKVVVDMRYLLIPLLILMITSCNVPVTPNPNISSPAVFEDVDEDFGEDPISLTPDQQQTFDVQGDIWSGVIHNPKAHLEGSWSQIFDWPLVAYNAALLPNGKVFTFGTKPINQYDGNGRSFFNDVWSPENGLGLDAHLTLANSTATNIFCAAQTLLSDGKLLIAGGDKTVDGQPEEIQDRFLNNAGVQDLTLYDYQTSHMTTSPIEMTKGRWYPTMTTLSNGDVLVQGGIDATKNPSYTPEVWTRNGTWKVLSGASSPQAYNQAWSYPFSFLAPNGDVFIAGKGANMFSLDPSNNGSIRNLGVRESIGRFQGTAVMYGEGKILIAGGGAAGGTPSASALTIDISGDWPVVGSTDAMSIQRKYLNATLLADGKVFVNGGSSGETNAMATAVYSSEIWNPETEKWQLGPSSQRPRMYHSTAILLPNGTVLTAGGDRPSQALNFNAEIYYPPYLFKKDGSGDFAPRPTITALSEVGYDQAFMATVGESTKVSRITLVRFGSVTHSFNMDQRFLELEFNQYENRLTIQSPQKPELAPPGYYMLFVFDENGVPSEAATVNLKPLN